MTVALRQAMTLDEFLAWENAQELRWEFDGVRPVATVGGTNAHETIALNIGAELRARLRGGPCRAYVSGMKVRMAATIRYPDAFVSCGPIANDALTANDPAVIFEVLSPSTSSVDQFETLREYQAIPSLRRYVLLPQDRIAAIVHERQDGGWTTVLLTDPGAVLAMPEIGVTIPLAEFYADVLERPGQP